MQIAKIFFVISAATLLAGNVAIAHSPDYANEPIGTTSLHIAARDGGPDDVRKAIDDSADVNARIDGGWTPLHYAAAHGRGNNVAILLEYNVAINAKTGRHGWTALHLAKFAGMAELLIENGANPNVKDAAGRTPKEYVWERNKDLMQVLTKAEKAAAE